MNDKRRIATTQKIKNHKIKDKKKTKCQIKSHKINRKKDNKYMNKKQRDER